MTGPTCPLAAAPILHTGDGTYYTFADGSGNCMFRAERERPQHGGYERDRLRRLGGVRDVRRDHRARRHAHHSHRGPVRGVQAGRHQLQCLGLCQAGAAGSLGRISIQWTYVRCAVAGPIVYHFKDGSNQWWTAVQIRNHRFGIAGFEYLDGTGQWQSVPRLDFNYFVAASGMGPGPYTFRVTDVNGATLQD